LSFYAGSILITPNKTIVPKILGLPKGGDKMLYIKIVTWDPDKRDQMIKRRMEVFIEGFTMNN